MTTASTPAPKIAVVFGTLNRLPFLERALASIPAAVGTLPCEIIVVDGGSDDGTLEYLRERVRERAGVRLVEQGERLGAVAAFNAGFRAATAEFVANFNDDAVYVGAVLANAVTLLSADPEIGQVAIPFASDPVNSADELAAAAHRTIGIAPEVQHVRTHLYGEIPYANFGVVRRELGEQVGWWGDYYQYGGDTELSVKVVQAGYRIGVLAPAEGYLIHYEVQDHTRIPNVEQPQFNARWRATHGKVKPVDARAAHAPVSPEPPPPHMPNPVLVRYLGQGAGRVTYQRPGSPYKYLVSSKAPDFWASASDADWLCGLIERGRQLFAKAPTKKR